MYRALLVVVALTGCAYKVSSPEEISVQQATSAKKFIINGGTHCAHITVDGMPCIYCERAVYGLNTAPALTCDWSKYPELE